MKKRLNSSILAATSLTAAATYHHQTEANPLILTPEQLGSLSPTNVIHAAGATTLDFRNLTPEIVKSLANTSINLSSFDTVREIILPWFAAKLNITLPSNFGTPVNDTYSKIKIIDGATTPSTDDDLNLNLTQFSNGPGKIIVDVSQVPIKAVQTGPKVSKLIRGTTTTNLTVADTIEDIETSGVMADDVKTSITLTPSAPTVPNSGKPTFMGLPTAILANNPNSLDISNFRIGGQDVTVSGMPKLEQLKTGSDDTIGTLKVTGEKNVTLNASVTKVEITSAAPDKTVVETLTAIATTVAPSGRDAHIKSFEGKTDLDFSKLDFGSVDNTATRIKEIFDIAVPITSAVSIKIGSSVLAAVMSKMNITNLSNFTALKRLDIISANGSYQASTLSAADLPSGLEEYYSSALVIRKGILTSELLIDKKFAASTIDFSGLDRNGKTISINLDYNNTVASTVKLNAELLSVAALKNLMSAGANKSVIVSGAAEEALTTANLQNVGTIDLRLVTGATSFSAPLNVDGDNGHLSALYLPAAFDVEASAVLSGVDNGEVTVYLSDAYSGAKTLDASYDKTILNFSAITGTGRFQLPSGIRGLVLSNAVTGLNVGAEAVANEFDLSGLEHLRQLTNLPISATVLKLNNSLASNALSLNLSTTTNLATLQLSSSIVSSLTLPAIQALTDGGEDAHLDLSQVTQLAEIKQLNELLSQGKINQVTFPTNPASSLEVNLVDTIEGIDFNNLDKISKVTLDNTYIPNENMWPTVKNRDLSKDWVNFFNYIIASEENGGINSPSIFDLSGQLIESQGQATALVKALNSLSSPNKNQIQKIIIRLSDSATGTIDFSAITPTQFNQGSLSIIIDKSTGSTASVTVPTDWNSKTKTYESLSSVNKSNELSWGNYLNYHFASLNDKGEAAISLDLSETALTAGEWSALMTALNNFSNPDAIQTVKLKLAAADNYTTAPAFTTATLSNATSVIVDVSGVKNAGSQVSVTELPTATLSLQVEQRVISASSVDRSCPASWKGYFEHLLANISGSSYTLDLAASDVQIETTAQLTALSTALSGLSSANKLKIQNIKLKIATGNRSTDFEMSTNLAGFTNLASVIVDATGALNGAAQSLTTFAFTNEPVSLTKKEVRVTSLAAVDTDAIASWNYYLAYHKAQNTNLQTLDFSSITLTAQADVTAFLTALQARPASDKSSVQTLKLKLASTFATDVDFDVDFSVDSNATQISGLVHASFAVEIDRNGANSSAPIGFTFGSGSGITAAKTTIKDSAFTSLGSFDGTNAHHWLGYVRTLLGTLSTGTMTLDLTTNSALEMNSAKLAQFITAMNALPASDKAKVETLKIKLASGDFGPDPADLSTITGFSGLTNVIIDRNGARESATLSHKAIAGTAPGSATLTINDPELRTVNNKDHTNEWLSYFTYLLNGMTGTTNTLDLSAFSITGDANVDTSFNNALESLPSRQKQKVQTLKLAASGAVTLGTGVSGFSNLDKVIVDQTAAPSEAVTIDNDFGSAKKFYVTSAAVAQLNGAWDKYVDYVLSTVAEGGLNQTAFNLSGQTLTHDEATAFLTALDGHDSAGDITGITLKLATAFGSASLDLSSYENLTSLAADSVEIHRNGASDSGAATSITYGGSFTDAKVRIIDPTAATITDTAVPGQWLGYMTGILNDAPSSVTLDLSGFALDDAEAVTAFNSALGALDSALANKIAVLKLNVTRTADITLGTGISGFTNLSRIEYTKPVGNTVTFAGALNGKRFYLTEFTQVKMSSSADWTHYLNYMLSTTNGGQSATALNLNSRTFADQAAVDAFFAGLNALSGTDPYGNKNVLTTLRMTLADGLTNIVVGRIDNNPTAATNLNANLRIVVNPGDSTDTTFAGANSGEVQADNLIVLPNAPVTAEFSKHYFAYAAEQPGFNGTLDLTGLNYTNATDIAAELNLLPSDIKSSIKTINLKLASGSFGSSNLTLGALDVGFTGVTLNIDRNGAVDGLNSYGPLVTIDNQTGHTVNLTDAEFHDMITFDNESSAHWIGYLTHELKSAPSSYTLDLTTHAALTLDSEDAVSALNNALAALSAGAKGTVATLKVNTSVDGELGTGVTGLSALANVIVEYSDANVTAMTSFFNEENQTPNHYVASVSADMPDTDWTRFFDYQLNVAGIGGRAQTSIAIDKRLSSAELTDLLSGLDAADAKASLQSLTLNLKSDVAGNIDVGASGLTGLTSVVINTNGSAAKLTPTNDFVGNTTFSSINNVNPAESNSWAAYLAGQSSITAIDIREVELAAQANLTAFLTALDAESRKADVQTLKLKLAGAYSGSVDFGDHTVTGLALTDNGVEVHRNGSTAAVTQGGDISTAKIKVVDLTASSLTDRALATAWLAYLTARITASGSLDLSADSDTYVRTNDQLTAFMTGLNNLAPDKKLLLTGLTVKLAPSASWTNVADLGQGLTGFTNLASMIVDATGAYTSAIGNPQVTVAFHADVNGASPKAFVTDLASVDKDSADSWTYFFNSAAMTTVDVSAVTLDVNEAAAFLGALGSGVTETADITAVTMKLDPTFGAANLTFDGTGFTSLTAITVHRNGAVHSNPPTPVGITTDNTSATLSIVDPTISDAGLVQKASASSWLAYLTDALSGVVTELDLTDTNLVLGTAGQATALSSALDALAPTLKAKVATLKLKAFANVTINATLTSAGGYTLTAIELDKPAANTITVNNIDASTQLHIADITKVKRTDDNDWLAYIQYLMKDLGAVTNFDLDMTASPLADGELQAFVDSLITISNNANSSGNKDKIEKVRLKAAPGVWSGNVNDLGQGWNGFMNNINTFTVDVTGATVSGEQLYISFSAALTDQSEYTKAFITDLSSVDKDNADAWEFYLNNLTKDGAAALDLSGITLSYVQLNALGNGLGAFSIAAAGNGDKLSSIHIKVSGVYGDDSNYEIAADLDAQTLIDSAAKFIVDISGFTYGGTQATVSHTKGTPKPVELRVSSASSLYRDSAASWDAYLNALYAGGIPAAITVNLAASSDTYLRNQTDVNALMSAIQSRSDKANIDTLNVRLAGGNVGSDITFGTGVTGLNPTMTITVSGATNNGNLLTASDIRYAGSFTSTGKTVTQAFASSVADQTVQGDWTQYLTYLLSARSDGGLGQSSIVAPALTDSAHLTALMDALNGLSTDLKNAINHIHLDVSANNSLSTLGTGVSGLSNLQEVTYVRASEQEDATAAVVESGDFSVKLQRLRTAWNPDTIASAPNIEAFLRYQLMDPEMGGLGQTIIDLTGQTLDSTQAGYLNSALATLPDDLSFRITELRLNLNAATDVTFDAAGLRNLSAIKYFKTGDRALTWTNASGAGFGSATKTRFRADLDAVSDKTSQAEWSEYIDYVLTPVNTGGLEQTTFDLRDTPLTSTTVVPFLAALDEHGSKGDVTEIKLKLAINFGAAALDSSGYTGLTGLTANSVEIHRNGAVFDIGGSQEYPVTITYGTQSGELTDSIVKIIDPETTTTADKDHTRQQWLEYLTYTIHTVELTDGLLTIAPADAFTSQAQVYTLFDALEALDSDLKAEVNHLYVNISGITTGAVSLARTADDALTGFDNLTAITYDRAGIEDGVTTYGSGTPALSRYRINLEDVTGKENGGQWAEYLLHKLSPASEGGLGATTIDISAAPLGNDQKNNFMAALSGGDFDPYRQNITSIKIAAVDNTLGDLDGGDKAYNDNLKIILIMNNYSNGIPTLSTANNQKFYASNGSTELTADNVIEYRITSAPTVDASATVWQRWLNHKLSSTFGGEGEGDGDGLITLDLSGTHEFTSQAQLNAFFGGLQALTGTNGNANKNVLESLTLKLFSGNFGAASVNIGHAATEHATSIISGLKSDIAITVQRNGAQNGGNTFSPLVTINYSNISTTGTKTIVDNTNTVVADLLSAPKWLEYLTKTLTAVTPQQVLDGYTLDLTGAGLQLEAGSSANQATALFNALQALDSTLKAKIAIIKIKLAAGDHGAGPLALSGTLNNTAGFTTLSRIIVDVTGATNDDNGTQKTIISNDLIINTGATKQSIVTDLNSVDLNSVASWGYYLNYLNDANSIDLYARDLYLTNQTTTQANVTAFFTALNFRASDHGTVKDIFLNISGADGLNINVGINSSSFSALTYVGIKRHAGVATFNSNGAVEMRDLAVINSSTTGLGANGTVAQWKGYFGYLLEDAAHGGVYTGSHPVALNLTLSDLEVASLPVLQAIETAIAELPARLKARISTLLIKTTNTNTNINYQSGGYPFGAQWTSDILDELSELKAVIINSCTNGGNDPGFPSSGDFFNRTSISKIMYHTTINAT